MARTFQILSVGYDRSLMKSRSLLLRSAGYSVEEAYSRHQALARVRSDAIDVLLICHTVPDNEKRALISAVRKQRLLIPILYISDNEFRSRDEDGCCEVSNAPEVLLAAIDSAVREMPGLRSPWRAANNANERQSETRNVKKAGENPGKWRRFSGIVICQILVLTLNYQFTQLSNLTEEQHRLPETRT